MSYFFSNFAADFEKQNRERLLLLSLHQKSGKFQLR